MICRLAGAIALALVAHGALHAIEPNETFTTATVLPAGTLLVADDLTVDGPFPNTLLGVRSPSGGILLTNDDDSPLGDGFASFLQNAPIPTGEIDFLVSGSGDDAFIGLHEQTGPYEVFVDVYDAEGVPIDSFSEVRLLEPGMVHEFLFPNPAWSGGVYDVTIDNTSGANDVDFFTFTGLTPGLEFAARTLDPNSSAIDTLLGWFDETGALVTSDDDGGGGALSLIGGMVPASGMLTFAVTGFGDTGFMGSHDSAGDYELQLTIGGGVLQGDYNRDGAVDAADYTVWRDTLGQMGAGLAADGNGNEQIDAGDYDVWKLQYGTAAGASTHAHNAANAVPEPSLALLMATSALTLFRRRAAGQASLCDAVARRSQSSRTP
jgi:hypothetical protein